MYVFFLVLIYTLNHPCDVMRCDRRCHPMRHDIIQTRRKTPQAENPPRNKWSCKIHHTPLPLRTTLTHSHTHTLTHSHTHTLPTHTLNLPPLPSPPLPSTPLHSPSIRTRSRGGEQGDFTPAQPRARERQELPPRFRISALDAGKRLHEADGEVGGFRQGELFCGMPLWLVFLTKKQFLNRVFFFSGNGQRGKHYVRPMQILGPPLKGRYSHPTLNPFLFSPSSPSSSQRSGTKDSASSP